MRRSRSGIAIVSHMIRVCLLFSMHRLLLLSRLYFVSQLVQWLFSQFVQWGTVLQGWHVSFCRMYCVVQERQVVSSLQSVQGKVHGWHLLFSR